MVSWASVVVAVCLVFMLYFIWRGLRMALAGKDLPEPEEGDYEIKVVGRTRSGQLLAVMSPKKDDKADSEKTGT